MLLSNPIIDVKNLVKRYKNKAVVNNISLQIEKGQIYGFLGPNGSGKTTTIRMICGLLTPDEGSGTCLGYDILNESARIKENIGYMTQAFSLYGDLSVRENLNFVARLFHLPDRKARVERAIHHLGLSNARADQLSGTLSGGWKQRLSLAAATLHDPQVLLLDEPTAGVDPTARREFWDEIYRLSTQGVTTLVSTHYMDEAERCHKLAYLAYGKLLAHGDIDSVIEDAALITYEIKGCAVHTLVETLKSLPAITSVASFGNTLHVSGQDEKKCLEALHCLKGSRYTLKKISPTLEDVFIHLMREATDNFD